MGASSTVFYLATLHFLEVSKAPAPTFVGAFSYLHVIPRAPSVNLGKLRSNTHIDYKLNQAHRLHIFIIFII